MEIRTAREDEIDAIAELLLRAYAEYAPAEPGPRRDAWDAYYTDEIPDVKSRWPISEHLVAIVDGRILGTATFFPDASHPELRNDAWPPGYAGMRLLGVDPAARGRGWGRLLTEECLRRARALGREWFGLHTTNGMRIARDMYERLGFTRYPDNDIPVTPDFTVVAYRLKL